MVGWTGLGRRAARTSVKTATNPIQRSMCEIIVGSELAGAAHKTSVTLSGEAIDLE